MMGMSAVAACWGTLAGAQVPLAIGGAADAGGNAAGDLPDHGLRAARPAPGLAADGRPLEPGDPGARVARQGFIGGVSWEDTWPGLLVLAGLLTVLTCWRCAACAESRLTERRSTRSPSATLRGNWAEGERDGVPLRLHRARAPATTRGSGTGTRASPALVWRRFDPRAGAARAEQPARGAAGRRLHRPHDLLGAATSTGGGARSTTSTRAALDRPRRSSRRCSPGPGGSRSATRRPSRGSRAHHEWLRANRDLEGDGLLWIDPARRVGARLLAEVRPGLGHGGRTRTLGFPLLVRRNRKLGWDARRIRDAGGPVLCEVVTNVLWGLALHGDGEPSITPALIEPLLGRAPRPLPRPGAARRASGPRSRPGRRWRRWRCPTCPRRSAGGWSRSTCSIPSEFWTPVPPPSVSARSRASSRAVADAARAPLLARADLGQLGLAAVDRAAAARLRRPRPTQLANAVCGVYRARGLCASTTTRSDGEGLGAVDFGWSALAAELAEPDPAAARSYL